MSTNVGFKQIEVFYDQVLGIGSYGKVCKAKCDNLLCAAKVLHSTLLHWDLFESMKEGRHQTWPLQQFGQECEFLSAIRHPNIIQYLGVHHDSTLQSPVLLMELMDNCLTNFLENSSEPIPYHVNINICRDVTLALTYLHSNNIVHRDLSSNNVLLTGAVRAKVTDFGMARICDLSPRAAFTKCPGTDVYMPPEAVQDQPMYTEKIDCFSFGVIAIQVLTKKFPDPGNRHRVLGDQCHPTTLLIVPEVERRHNHISQIDQSNPLLPIALDCLCDVEAQRPSAQHLCERLAQLQERQEYRESLTAGQVSIGNIEHTASSHEAHLRLLQQVHELIQSNANRLEEKERIISCLQQENLQLRDQIEQYSQDNECFLQQNTRLQNDVQTLQQQLKQTLQDANLRGLQKDSEMRQEEVTLREQLQQIRHEQREKNETILDLQATTLRQKQFLDDCSAHVSQLNSRISQKDQKIHQLTQNLHRLERQRNIEDLSDQVKTEVEKHLSRQKHLSSISVSTTSSIKGMAPDPLHVTKELPATEFQLEWIKNSENNKAPCAMVSHCNAVVHGDIVYFQPTYSNSLYAYNVGTDVWSQLPECKNRNCSLAAVKELLTAIGGTTFIGYSKKLYSLTGEIGKAMTWKRILPSMPTKRSESSAVCTGMALIVVGGEGKSGEVLSTVEVMNTDTEQWSTAADLPEPLWGASPTLCGNILYVVGGVNVQPTKSAYKCSTVSLLQSCKPTFPCGVAESTSETWSKMTTDLPVTVPTCVSIYGHLVLIGGEDSHGKYKRTSAIHRYNQATASWEIISEMPVGRNQCFAAMLADNRLMVVGGWIDTTKDQTASATVDFASTIVLNP